MKKLYFCLAVILAACNVENESIIKNETPAHLSISTEMVTTRAFSTGLKNDVEFEKANQIGVTLTYHAEYTGTGDFKPSWAKYGLDNSSDEGHLNQKATYNGQSWSFDNKVVLSDNERWLTAYYPYSTDYNVVTISGMDITRPYNRHTIPVDISSYSNGDGQQDYLWGEATDSVSNSHSNARIKFQHVLPRITFNITKGENYANKNIFLNRVILKNATEEGSTICTQGTMNVITGSTSAETSAGDNIVQKLATYLDTETPCSADFLTFPLDNRKNGDDILLRLEIGSSMYSTYTFYDILIPKVEWKGGMQYTYPVTVSQAHENGLYANVYSLNFAADGGTESVMITSDAMWIVKEKPSWISISPIDGRGDETTKVDIIAEKNTDTSERTGEIILSQVGFVGQVEPVKTISISVIQAAASQLISSKTITVNGVSFKIIKVDGGTFTMGATSEQGNDAFSNEFPTHSVTLNDYYIGETEVTQELWEAVMGSNPSGFKSAKRPVEKVSWDDCLTFIEKLNLLTGNTFRLPTEAEWEYAARGGNKSKGYKYAGSNTIDDVAWYADNSSYVGASNPNYGTHIVATKQANELGIYDMSGNIVEWCQDGFGSYDSINQTNPIGSSSGSSRVLRGGSWYFSAEFCRVSCRSQYQRDIVGTNIGFRIVM